MIKGRHRVSPRFQASINIIIDAMLEERKRGMPAQLKRCVAAIIKKEGGAVTREAVSKAFAICTKSLQSKGYLKKGSHDTTAKGATRSRSKAADKEHVNKMASYEDMLAAARGDK